MEHGIWKRPGGRGICIKMKSLGKNMYFYINRKILQVIFFNFLNSTITWDLDFANIGQHHTHIHTTKIKLYMNNIIFHRITLSAPKLPFHITKHASGNCFLISIKKRANLKTLYLDLDLCNLRDWSFVLQVRTHHRYGMTNLGSILKPALFSHSGDVAICP